MKRPFSHSGQIHLNDDRFRSAQYNGAPVSPYCMGQGLRFFSFNLFPICFIITIQLPAVSRKAVIYCHLMVAVVIYCHLKVVRNSCKNGCVRTRAGLTLRVVNTCVAL